MSKPKPIVDLSDLFMSNDEALDLLGDLLPAEETSLFGEPRKKIAKSRPKWQVDGFTVVQKVCQCRTCRATHSEVNQYILVSESLVDFAGNVLKSHKTANPESLRHKDINFDELLVSHEKLVVEDIDYCQYCSTSSATVLAAFRRQQLTLSRKAQDDVDSIEQELLDMIAALDKKEEGL